MIIMSTSHKSNVALSSVFAAVFLTGIKVVFGIITGSLGIIAEAAHSALDLGAAVMTYFAVRIGDKPADERHPYGHGKFESLSAFIEVGLLLVTCVWIFYEAVQRLITHKPVEFHWGAVIVMVISIIVDFSRSQALLKAAKKYKSQALEADALHFSSDIYSSLVVIFGLLAIKYGGYYQADSIAAMFVAGWVLVICYRLARQTVDTLLDTSADFEVIKKIRELTQSVEGVSDIDYLRARFVGPILFINLIIHVRRTMPLEQAHTVATEVERQLKAVYPESDIIIHVEPLEHEEENLIDKIRIIGYQNNLPVHNIEAHESGDKIHVNLDVEFDKNITFESAHEMATKLEQQIRQSIPGIGKVTAHLETLESEIEAAQDVTHQHHELIKRIQEASVKNPVVHDCHHVYLQQSGNHLTATLHCSLDKGLNLAQVHELSDHIEKTVLLENPELTKVLVHCEPK